MTTATPARYADCDSESSHEVSVAAMALGARALPVGKQPPWHGDEDNVVAAAISVILVALFAIIAVAAAAVLTMG